LFEGAGINPVGHVAQPVNPQADKIIGWAFVDHSQDEEDKRED
jgi:hypothetical protein